MSWFQRNVKVAVCGASGGIGQPLSLLLKESPLVSELSLYDIVHTVGVAADLSHIETKAKVKGFVGADQVRVRFFLRSVMIIWEELALFCCGQSFVLFKL